MPIPRAVLRSILPRRTSNLASRVSVQNISRSHPLRQSGGHYHAKKPGSDMPWLIGSFGFTIPVVYFLLSTSPPKPHYADPHQKMDTGSSPPGDIQTDDEGHQDVAKGEDKHADDVKTTPKKEEDALSLDTAEDVNDAKDQTKEKASEAENKASELVDGDKSKAKGAAEGATEEAKEVKEEAKEATSSEDDIKDEKPGDI